MAMYRYRKCVKGLEKKADDEHYIEAIQVKH